MPASQAEERPKAFPHISEDFDGSGCGEFHAPRVPIQVLDVIGQDGASHFTFLGQSNLERIAFRVTRDRAGNRKARFRVVRPR